MAEHVERMVADGDIRLETSSEPASKGVSDRRYNQMTDEEQSAHDKRIANSKKTVYLVNGYNLGKTAYDYAIHLAAKVGAAPSSSPQDATAQPTSGFGPIYAQFKGKPKEAIAYLLAQKSGEAIGALHHEKIGDISIVWGDENGGLSHIVGKHVGEGKSFETIEKAADEIEGIINNGSIVFENGDKAVFKIGNKLVTVRKNYRENGKKIADKNWVLTAYDETLADGGNSAITATNQGKAAPAAKEFDGKDSKSSPTSQKTTNGKGGKAMSGAVPSASTT